MVGTARSQATRSLERDSKLKCELPIAMSELSIWVSEMEKWLL